MARSSKTTINEDLVRQLAGLLDETGLTEIEYGADGVSIRVARQVQATVVVPAAGPAPAPAATVAEPSAPAAEPSCADHPGAIASPMVGVVYTSPDPDAPAFVKVGDEVVEGQTLFLIEAMKVFNPIAAPRAGRITHVLVDNETPVEFGEPLAVIE
ncbi:MAG: acetyl-CoA carboxylase biotin carboxyl carrier protein [Rhodospirillaceae bacterium]